MLILGNLAAAWSPNYEAMLAARVLVGIGMGGVWAIAAGIAVRLVPARSVGPATSLVSAVSRWPRCWASPQAPTWATC